MIIKVDANEQDERFTSGPWRGIWTQQANKAEMDLRLEFKGGRIYGEGSDQVGEFSFCGSYNLDTGEVRVTKRYIGRHRVTYRGWAELQHGIWGLWNLEEGNRGGWQIRPAGCGSGSHGKTHASRPRATGAVNQGS